MENGRLSAQRLYVEGKLAGAIAEMRAWLGNRPEKDDTDDLKFLSFLEATQGDHLAALKTMQLVHQRAPADQENLKNIGVCYLRLRQYGDAVQWLERALALDEGDSPTHDALAHAHGNLGHDEYAKRHGRRALELKAAATAGITPIRDLAEIPLPKFRPSSPARNVLSFSLWGRDHRCLSGAVENARLTPELYPGWRCRFYCGKSVPASVMGELQSLGADLVLMPEPRRLYEGLFWRFQICWDRAIDRYLIRDADSIINLKERAAVDEWIDSEKHFHILRDFYSHSDLILAGLWGGVRRALPDLSAEINHRLDSHCKPKACDQQFLKDVVWPVARQSCLIHDSWFEALGSRPYPKHAILPRGRHIGQNAQFHPPARPGAAFRLDQQGAYRLRQPRQRFVFTLTTGRSGTSYLAKLLALNLPEAEVHHERLDFENLGVHSPDASHFTRFNAVGNVPEVQSFWRRKLSALKHGPGSSYAETSHFLAKAGLIENLAVLGAGSEVHLIVLKRDPEELVWSLANRMDFANLGFTWLFALDPRYPRNIVDPAPLKAYEMFGHCYWYVMEMEARAAYYRRLIGTGGNIQIHQVELQTIATAEGAKQLLAALGAPVAAQWPQIPTCQNETKTWSLGEEHRAAIKHMIEAVPFDPAVLADRFVAAGRRIG